MYLNHNRAIAIGDRKDDSLLKRLGYSNEVIQSQHKAADKRLHRMAKKFGGSTHLALEDIRAKRRKQMLKEGWMKDPSA